MKHLRKFNESNFIEPIDVELDIIEFRKRFIEPKEASLKTQKNPNEREVSSFELVKKKISELELQYPTMTDKYEVYSVYNANNRVEEMVLVKAVSYAHAFIKAAIELNTGEIAYHRLGKNKTDKWKGIVMSKKSIEWHINECELKLSKLKNIK